MAYDFYTEPPARLADAVRSTDVHSLDGEGPISPVLRQALQDPTVPQEVKALVLNLKALDPVDATLEARTLVRALKGDHRDAVGIFGGGQLMRRTLREWELDLPQRQREASADRLVEIFNRWADEELRAVL